MNKTQIRNEHDIATLQTFAKANSAVFVVYGSLSPVMAISGSVCQ